MADFAIGDVQGCFIELMTLLEKIHFNEHHDRLWFVGDLVNRGKNSLEVLRFISSLPNEPIVTLGNHDLHLLALIFAGNTPFRHQTSLDDILNAPDKLELGHWLQKQRLAYFDKDLNIFMAHAGLPPLWSIAETLNYAHEIEVLLQSHQMKQLLEHMYGNEPNLWDASLSDWPRYRLIINYLTRMRFCTPEGALDFAYNGKIHDVPESLMPWFQLQPQPHNVDIVFGHWAAIEGKTGKPHIHALDTGCVWGGKLTALRLQDKMRFEV